MADFCVAPPRRINIDASSRRRALKSSHFLASKDDANSVPCPSTKNNRLQRLLFLYLTLIMIFVRVVFVSEPFAMNTVMLLF